LLQLFELYSRLVYFLNVTCSCVICSVRLTWWFPNAFWPPLFWLLLSRMHADMFICGTTLDSLVESHLMMILWWLKPVKSCGGTWDPCTMVWLIMSFLNILDLNDEDWGCCSGFMLTGKHWIAWYYSMDFLVFSAASWVELAPVGLLMAWPKSQGPCRRPWRSWCYFNSKLLFPVGWFTSPVLLAMPLLSFYTKRA